jgi:hypothetical protein
MKKHLYEAVEVQNESGLETFLVCILERFMVFSLIQDPRHCKYKKYKNIHNFCAYDVCMNLKKLQSNSSNQTHSLYTYNMKDQIRTLLMKIYTAFVKS